jgi:hypothetical protein
MIHIASWAFNSSLPQHRHKPVVYDHISNPIKIQQPEKTGNILEGQD